MGQKFFLFWIETNSNLIANYNLKIILAGNIANHDLFQDCIDLSNYSATLGHKVIEIRHSIFKYNI